MHTAALIFAAITVGCALAANCPAEWMANKAGTKCYLVAPTVNLDSMWDQIAFCTNIGGKVVEPVSVDELNEVKAIAATYAGKFTNGPWVNYFALNDNRVLSGSTLKPAADAALNKLFQDQFARNGNATWNCLGFDADGTTFDFDNCIVDGNPFCEQSLGNSGY